MVSRGAAEGILMKSRLGFWLVLTVCFVLLASARLEAQKPTPSHMEWWAQSRFGIFVHWGPISLKGAEISWSRANTNSNCPNAGPIPAEEYDNLYHRFNPVRFNAREWVRTAKAAGAGYIVLTAKHCDGFLLWDSKVSDYNIMNTPFHRDVCAELAKAAHEEHLRIGWYFSPMDWKDPDCRGVRNSEFVARMQGEIRELLSNYGRIDLIWFDYDGRSAPWDQAATYALVKRLQPEIVINNRLDLGENTNAGLPQSMGPHADYYTPEQWIGGYDDQNPWESCMTLSTKNQWSWGGADDGVKPLNDCLEMILGGADGDGNILLDIGPMPSGEIPPAQVTRLEQIGAWLKKSGRSIHQTRGGPYRPGEYGGTTRSGNTVYLHLKPRDGYPLKLPALPAKVLRAHSLNGGRVAVTQGSNGIEISLLKPAVGPATVVALELDRSAIGLPAIDVLEAPNLCFGATATASNVFQNMAEYTADKAIDIREDTRWATDNGTRAAWIQVDFGKPVKFSRAVVVQAYPELQRIKRWAIEYFDEASGEWKTCSALGLMPSKASCRFAPVTARKARLNILEASDGPTIWEFKLYAE